MRTAFFRALAVVCILYSTLHATIDDSEMVVIDSELADYNGEKCVLTGHVTVEHAIGTLSAKQIVMEPASGADKSKPASLQILGDVIFSLKEGGRLQCARADLDYHSLCGVFSSDFEEDFVVFSEDNPGKELIIKGRQMEMLLSGPNEKKHEGAAGKSNVREMTIDGDVVINYAEDFVAHADHALYRRKAADVDQAVNSQALSGIVHLRADPASQCQVMTKRGDCIKAQEIAIDTVLKELTFKEACGRLNPSGTQQELLQFVADRLLWQEQNHLLTLQGHVKVLQGNLANLDAEEVRVLQRVVDGQKELVSVETAGKATLSHANEDKNLDHSLTCHGPVKIDHLKMEVRMHSPKDEQGRTPENQQIHFDDIKGEIFADKALITYQLIEGAVVPSKIVLGGNVRVLNTLTRHRNGITTALQYALADQVEYVPHSNEMLFKSNSGRRVLFFDKTNNLQVSAPALKIVRGITGARKDTIQGYGDVRFSFVEHEFEQLRKCFTLDKFNLKAPTPSSNAT